MSFKTALILGLICQSIGLMLFGPESYFLYGGLMTHWNKLAPYPRVTMYSLMWIVVMPVIWQSLAIWRKTLVPPYLGNGMPITICSLVLHSLSLLLLLSVAGCVLTAENSSDTIAIAHNTTYTYTYSARLLPSILSKTPTHGA